MENKSIRHIIPISGKDSLCTAIVQKELEPNFNYEYVFNPTGLELPEVFDWLKKVEDYLGKPIIKVGKPLKKIIKDYNYFLPSQKSRYCTRESKIEPFINFINGDECLVYYGIRFDEERVGFDNKTSKNITPIYPLKQKKIDLNGVYLILNSKGLKPPTFYWKELHEKVTKILGYDPKGLIAEWIFDMLFAWRSRANCDRCFNQRKYEWVGLLIFHPELYWDASSMETMGSEGFKRTPPIKDYDQQYIFSNDLMNNLVKDDMEGVYTFCSDKEPLEKLAKRAKKIFNNRAYQVAKIINRMLQVGIFQDPAEKEIIDTLNLTSCGLMCGK